MFQILMQINFLKTSFKFYLNFEKTTNVYKLIDKDIFLNNTFLFFVVSL